MAKRQPSSQRSPEGEPESLTSKLKLDKKAVSLDRSRRDPFDEVTLEREEDQKRNDHGQKGGSGRNTAERLARIL